MAYSYDVDLVGMSALVAAAASYVAFDLGSRAARSTRTAAQLWLFAAALALGSGQWAAQLIGLLAHNLPLELRIQPGLSVCALAAGIAGVEAAFLWRRRAGAGIRAWGIAGLFAGSGAIGMNALGIAALRIEPALQYRPWGVAVAVAAAALGPAGAFCLAQSGSGAVLRGKVRRRIAAAAAMAAGLLILQYAAMESWRVVAGARSNGTFALDQDNNAIGHGIGLMLILMLGLALLTAVFDSRLAAHSVRMLRRVESANRRLRREVREKERLLRVQRVLSGVNALIVRARSRRELFEGACRIAVEQGRLRMAVVATVVDQQVTPVAVYGVNDGYIEKIRVNLSSTGPEAQGPTARALRDKRIGLCNDIATDPVMAPWREAALSRGYRSAATFPLFAGGMLVGCINLYAAEPFFFNSDELKLLAELARNVSYAMAFIEREEHIDYLSYFDPLTGLANRRLFLDRVGQSLQVAQRGGSGLAVLMFDIDQFKSLNDTLGSAVGDELLKLLAQRLAEAAGGAHAAARLGGDRFAAMLPYLSMPGESPLLLDQRFDAALERVFAVDGQEVHVSVRVGVALFPADGDSAETLLRNAEAALKRAKALGERRLFYSEEMSRVLREKLDLGNRLRRALQQGEFVLFYQPKLDVRQGSICGAEALIRWRSPELGLVPPNCFVPMLEESGLIVEAGRWALRQAVRDRREWMAQGLPAPRIAVNVSPLQLRRPDFVDMLKDALAEGGAAGIDLEITESALMSDVEEHLDKLRAARGMGLSIAIDDFGTGYSSLAYLTRLPVDAIKIDRSFIMRMTDAADTMNIVATIVSLAHTMKLKVIAEGVETAEQLRFLRLLRCDQMQGFLFSPGLAPAQFAELLKSGQLSLHGMGTRPLAA